MRRLIGKVAIVTGAGSGIGAATAERLGAEGAAVALADVDHVAAERIAARIVAAGSPAHAYHHDVASRESWAALVPRVVADLGGLDVLVNNAGVTRDRSLLKMTDDEWQTVLDVHLRGMWLGCQHVVPVLRERGGGAIVCLSSEARHGQFGQSNYAAAKAGIVALARTVAIEHGRHGIRANCVAPGPIDTPMTAPVPQAVKEAWMERNPLGRFGQPQEIAAAIAFLASDDASYVSGQCLNVDGGASYS